MYVYICTHKHACARTHNHTCTHKVISAIRKCFSICRRAGLQSRVCDVLGVRARACMITHVVWEYLAHLSTAHRTCMYELTCISRCR